MKLLCSLLSWSHGVGSFSGCPLKNRFRFRCQSKRRMNRACAFALSWPSECAHGVHRTHSRWGRSRCRELAKVHRPRGGAYSALELAQCDHCGHRHSASPRRFTQKLLHFRRSFPDPPQRGSWTEQTHSSARHSASS